MRKIKNWIKLWFTFSKESQKLSKKISKVSEEVSFIDERLEKLRKMRVDSDQKIDTHLQYLYGMQQEVNEAEENFNDVKEEFKKEWEKIESLLKEAKLVNLQLEEALGAAHQELETANKILIPGLVAANRTLIDRWEQESAVLAMRTAAMGVSKDIE